VQYVRRYNRYARRPHIYGLALKWATGYRLSYNTIFSEDYNWVTNTGVTPEYADPAMPGEGRAHGAQNYGINSCH